MQKKILICGEAYGKDEEAEGLPFVGASGRELDRMLGQVGLSRHECHLTNVFNLRPQPRNDVTNLCGPKAEGITWMPYLQRGKHVAKKYEPELHRLYAEVRDVRPNLVVAFGATAAWAFLKSSGIRQIRGAAAPADEAILDRIGLPQLKILPTYHPAAVLREWKLRPIVIADLIKAKDEAEFPDVRRPQREVWIEPTLPDLWDFYQRYLHNATRISIDIETVGDQITCIGFAPNPRVALVVPIFDYSRTDRNYWRTLGDELEAWRFIRKVCEHPAAKIGQNFNYDSKFLLMRYGIAVPVTDDTMLLHHALQPEMEKGLSFLGTIYTSEASWKMMRKKDTVKRED